MAAQAFPIMEKRFSRLDYEYRIAVSKLIAFVNAHSSAFEITRKCASAEYAITLAATNSLFGIKFRYVVMHLSHTK